MPPRWLTRMSDVPTGGETARPFLPARDFDLSKRFYEALGFEKLLDSDDVAIFRMGSSSFLLQRRFQRQWAENCMMQLMVDDVDAWWAHITRLDLPRRFGVKTPQADPTGVLWHIAQRREGIAHD